jgi:hypothetical protein
MCALLRCVRAKGEAKGSGTTGGARFTSRRVSAGIWHTPSLDPFRPIFESSAGRAVSRAASVLGQPPVQFPQSR